ncbi:hypothetical protein AVEN_37579-1 [Araneus ventricosus]|uniref:Uncharacterized protein n=1 Tax=Araneus ventricosus TaxID=182803 RepID=A0A4Y2UTG2_ARAVE|nr:hypothetical protein AVEN_37579-1 [Araneus ventricosus]
MDHMRDEIVNNKDSLILVAHEEAVSVVGPSEIHTQSHGIGTENALFVISVEKAFVQNITCWRTTERIQDKNPSCAERVAKDLLSKATLRIISGPTPERSPSNVLHVAKVSQRNTILRFISGHIVERSPSHVLGVTRNSG